MPSLQKDRSCSSRSLRSLVTIGGCFLFFCLVAQPQAYLTQIGNTTFSVRVPVEMGYYDASTGDLHIAIPLGTWPQRGGSTLSLALMYDSRIWSINNSTWQPSNVPNSTGGWRLVSLPVSSGGSPTYRSHIRVKCENGDPGQTYNYYDTFSWTDSLGTVHAFPIYTQNDPTVCNGGTTSSDTEAATDGSGYVMAVTNYTTISSIYDASGALVYGTSSSSYKDRNGNYFHWDTSGNPNDTTGRVYVKTTTNCNGNSNQICYDVSNSQNNGTSGTSRYTVTTESVAVQTLFQQSGVTEYSGNVTVYSSIALPDGTSYQFNYDHGGAGTYGELTSMTLPAGGSVQYSYATYTDMFANRNIWLESRTAAGAQWSYVTVVAGPCPSGYAVCQTDTIFRPDGRAVGYTFGSNSGSPGSWLTNVTFYNAIGSTQTPLVSQSTTWTSTTSANAMPASVTTQMMDAPSGTPSTTVQYTYTGTNIPLISTVKEWNYYTGSLPSSPDRTTTITYGYFGNALSYQRPTSVTLTNGSGTATYRQATTSYDGSSLTSVTGVVNHDDSNYGTGFTSRGNPTSMSQRVSATGYLTTNVSYDMTGQAVAVVDAAGNTITFGYADHYYVDGASNPPASYSPPQVTNAYLTSKTLPLSGSITYGYFFGTGALATAVDQNAASTYMHYMDSLSRPTSVISPLGGWSLWQYPSGSEAYTDVYIGITDTVPSSSCASCSHDHLAFDGLGRTTSQALVSDPDGSTTEAYQYDGNGRILSRSTPYRTVSDPTYGVDSIVYDGFDRILSIAHTDGSAQSFYYGSAVTSHGGQSSQLCQASVYGTGYPVLMIDEAGKKRETWTDGFGRVIEIDEPGSSGALTSQTCYGYDPANDLLSVAPLGTAGRTYAYDLLGRLIQSAEPETGTVNYYYTTVGGGLCGGRADAVCRRVDARGIITTYTYDAENRLTGRSYSDGVTPAVAYYYDQTSYDGLSIVKGKGRMTGMADGSGQSAWSYDAGGDVTSRRQTISGIAETLQYVYNPDKSLASLTYPSGHAVTYTYSNARRATSAIDSASGITYVQGASYAPMGAPSSATMGHSSAFNGIISNYNYNSRLQVGGVSVTVPGSTLLSLTNSYTQPGGNNGAIASVTNNIASGRSLAITYDYLNRISAASTQASSGQGCWGLSFGDDGVGNLLTETVTQCSAYSLAATVNSKNQLVGYSYDAAGNMLGDGLYTYTYSAENQITSAAGVTYSYDGTGFRDKKSSGTLYWRDLGGATLTETDLSGALRNEYVFFGGRRVALRTTAGNVYYYFTDHLANTRILTDASGNKCYDTDFAPYGEEMGPFTNSCGQNYKFTGYERDPETGLDYAVARYYNSRTGRFMSPDPYGGSSDTGDPQTMNRYSYVMNNPFNSIDPTGTCDVVVGGITQQPNTPKTASQQQYANSVGAISAFPYSNEGLGYGLNDVLAQGDDTINDATRVVMDALQWAARDPGPINITTWSGGAQAVVSALAHLPEVAARVGNVTYLSPGVADNTALYQGNGQTEALLGSGNADFAVTSTIFGNTANIGLVAGSTGCQHDANCAFTKNAALLNSRKGAPCSYSAPKVFYRGLGTISPGTSGPPQSSFDEFDWLGKWLDATMTYDVSIRLIF